MNKKIIKNLWVMANKMHGTFEVTELCRVMIYSLFLEFIRITKNKAEEECFTIYDDKFSVGYLALTYGKMVHAYEVARYVATLEREFGMDNSVIADDLERLLNKADEDMVRNIFDVVASIKFESKEQLYEVTLLLLNKLAQVTGKTGVESFTSVDVCKLETRLLDCQEGMFVYDGFCGSGVSINEVSGNRGIVYMQDINLSTVALATVITLLKGNKVGAIRCGDSQLNPMTDMQYDRIVCEPPFNPKYSNEYLQSVPENNCICQDILNSESLALRHVLAHLKEDGIATVIVPMGMLFKSGRMAVIREILVKNYIDAVIELPSGVWMNTGVATALLVLKKNKADDSIYMINAKSFFDKVGKIQLTLSDENADRIAELYKSKEVIEGVSNKVSIEKIATNEFNLCTMQYVTLSPEDAIVIEDIVKYSCEYEQLRKNLIQIDENLNKIRMRWLYGKE